MDEPKSNLVTSGNAAGPPSVIPPRPPSVFQDYVHAAFVGPDGLRTGWRVVLYLTMAVGIGFLLLWPLHYLHPQDAAKMWLGMLAEFLVLSAVVVPAVVMGRFEKRPFGAYGLPVSHAFGKGFWVGAVWGFVSLTVLLLTLRGAAAFYFGGLALHGVQILKFALYWAIFFLMVGFSEEFLLRGYTQFTLARGIGFWPSATLLSLTFGALHLGNQGEAWIGALAAAFIGFFFCLTLRRTGNLWFAVGFHAWWDWGESYLYSVPDSGSMVPGHLLNSSFQGPRWLTGGSVGPEGSVVVFVVIALMWVAFDRVYPEVKYQS